MQINYKLQSKSRVNLIASSFVKSLVFHFKPKIIEYSNKITLNEFHEFDL